MSVTIAARAGGMTGGMFPFFRGPAPDHGCVCARPSHDEGPDWPTNGDLAAHALLMADACAAWVILHRSRMIVPERPEDVEIGRLAVDFFTGEVARWRAAHAMFGGNR